MLNAAKNSEGGGGVVEADILWILRCVGMTPTDKRIN